MTKTRSQIITILSSTRPGNHKQTSFIDDLNGCSVIMDSPDRFGKTDPHIKHHGDWKDKDWDYIQKRHKRADPMLRNPSMRTNNTSITRSLPIMLKR
jgi:hypothetical protein